MLAAVAFTVLTVAMIVGPIMMLRPSPRQKQITQLRSLAAQRGLRVQMLDNPVKSAPSTRPGAKAKAVAAYCMQLQIDADSPLNEQRWMLVRAPFAHDIHLGKIWDWANPSDTAPIAEEPLLAYLQQLPETVLALRQDGKGLSLLWSEAVPPGKTLEQAFDTLQRHLTKLAELLYAAVQTVPHSGGN